MKPMGKYKEIHAGIHSIWRKTIDLPEHEELMAQRMGEEGGEGEEEYFWIGSEVTY